MARTLQPEDRIAHYRVVGSLGVGGMGEVYIAQDQTLDRSVALKVLPAGLVRNQERVRRFVTEAKSASSLSHPHIVTIYEIGEDRVRSGDEPADESSEAVHYISMELIQGKTLHDKIHHEKSDLRTLLGILAQAAEGLAKAHASGIVHRDLKPSNIMVSQDGYAKVLDFGLAKLTERTQSDGEATLAATAVAPLTGEGVVLGTVGYMSPEQVRGKAVDHRADIFSFGCILYEAVTRHRPFKADSDVETMHQILNQQPEALEEIAPDAPDAVRRLIKRCLAKAPERRLHSMKDIAIELAEIVEEFDTLAPSRSASSFGMAPVQANSKRPSPALLALGGVAIVALAFAIWSGLRRSSESATPAQPFQTMTMSSVVRGNDIRQPTLSRDGRYLAYCIGRGEASDLWVRQVETGSQVKVYTAEQGLRAPVFSPDGNYIYFLMRDPETPNYSAAFSIPTLGGSPRKRAFDVDSQLSFSPDGRRACFRRGLPQRGQHHLIVFDLETGVESTRVELANVLGVDNPIWSPDGRSIAWISYRIQDGYRSSVSLYDVDSGEPRTVELPVGIGFFGSNWLADGAGLVGAASRVPSRRSQIWSVDLASGGLRRVTNDLNDYFSISVGEQGKAISAIRGASEDTYWTVGIDGSEPARRIEFGDTDRQLVRWLALPNGELVSEVEHAESVELVRIAADGSNVRPLSSPGATDLGPSLARDHLLFVRLSDPPVPHIWSMDLDGGSVRQLTHGGGELLSATSSDGRYALYTTMQDASGLRMLDTTTGEDLLLEEAVGEGGGGHFSPDGRYVLWTSLRELDGRWRGHFIIYSIETGRVIHEIAPPRPAITGYRWIPGTDAISYGLSRGEGSEDLYRIALDGSGDAALTRFDDGRIVDSMWSPDGRHLVLVRRHDARVSLWIQSAEAGRLLGEPRELASFDEGFLDRLIWLDAIGKIAFQQSITTQDVVMVRNFQ